MTKSRLLWHRIKNQKMRFSSTVGFLRETPGDGRIYGVVYVSHNIPDQLMAGSIYGARITLENSGDFTWRRDDPGGSRIDLVLRLDGRVVGTYQMPRSMIKPGEQTTVCFPLNVPHQEGEHPVSLELVDQGAAWFSERGVSPLKMTLNSDASKGSSSDDPLEVSRSVNPWHYRPTGGIERSGEGMTFPLFVSKAKGCHLWDQAGRRYIDYIMAWGSTILGYADDRIQAAIGDVLEMPPLMPFPSYLEMDVARMLTEDIPCAEMVVFGKNGSDVCTVAARLARLHTGKRVILCSGYHGWQDFWVEADGFGVTGVPDRPEPLIHRFRFNDRDDFFRLFKRFKGDLAAVMLEPSGPGESIQGPEQDADKDFLATIAEATRSEGALLVFDEIITGYRYPTGSVQKATGIVPDLACLGKAIGSGMPLAALVGKTHIFEQCMERTHYGPTFKGEVYSFAAAKAAIQIYRSEPVAETIWDYGTRLKNGLNSLCATTGVNAGCKGPPFRTALIFHESDADRLRLKRTLYIQELLKRGITTYNGIMLPSYAHDDLIMEKTLEAMGETLERIAHAEKQNNFERYLEIPIL
ncbi:MAG: aminotransferase class III-fold pyridoxal phosphate-dependent enzyme [Deltaproteobacteria bacterium]|jgi:glutamate-1-semialdehyde 2,1-aminomutase|nr:aminotransferase class III-fold pyridoxal phosphate-dependent enzyme [Deltaproteobacteria bacterium]